MVLLGHIDLMKKYYKSISWSSYDLPRVFEQRGVHEPEKLPGFHYRDDALRLWHAIKEYVTKILSIYYHSDEDIKKVCGTKTAMRGNSVETLAFQRVFWCILFNYYRLTQKNYPLPPNQCWISYCASN